MAGSGWRAGGQGLRGDDLHRGEAQDKAARVARNERQPGMGPYEKFGQHICSLATASAIGAVGLPRKEQGGPRRRHQADVELGEDHVVDHKWP